jgi:hypothetical protein
MDYLREVNRKPLKDELLLQGLSCGNITAIEDPHSNTSFPCWFCPIRKTKVITKQRNDRAREDRTTVQQEITFWPRKARQKLLSKYIIS